MDSAILDSCRCDYTRCNVTVPDMDEALKKLSSKYGASTLTRKRIASVSTIGAPAYIADDTITGAIQPQGTNLNGLPLSTIAKYTNTLWTPDPVLEGDRVIDCNGDAYDVHAS
jgi:hypothetical protein